MYIFGGLCGLSHADSQIFCLHTDTIAVKEKIEDEVNTIKAKNLVHTSTIDLFENMLCEFDTKLQLRVANRRESALIFGNLVTNVLNKV